MQAVEEIKQETASSIVSRVEDGERVRVKIEGKEFALISIEDLEFLEDVENKLDLLAGLEALERAAKEGKFSAHEDVVKDILKSRIADDV